MGTAKERISNRSHLEPAKGSPEQNRTYCSKPETRLRGPYEFGTIRMGQGTRRDLLEFNQGIREGMTNKQLIETYTQQFYKYYKVIDHVRMVYTEKRSWPMENIVYWGDSGSGKTRRALEEAGDSVYFVSKGDANQSTWWDGYEGQNTVILDDFYGWLPWTFMLRLLDRYPFSVQYKGGSREFISKKIIITSNTAPETWYKNIPNNDFTPFRRRLTNVVHLINL